MARSRFPRDIHFPCMGISKNAPCYTRLIGLEWIPCAKNRQGLLIDDADTPILAFQLIETAQDGASRLLSHSF
jgi:hypothetical protein